MAGKGSRINVFIPDHQNRTGQDSIREALSRYRAWIESKLRVPWSSRSQFKPVCRFARSQFVGCSPFVSSRGKRSSSATCSCPASRHSKSLDTCSRPSAPTRTRSISGGARDCTSRETALEWLDVPVLVRIRDFQASFIALQVPYIETFESHKQEWQNLIVAPRHLLADVMDLLRDLSAKQEGPQLIVHHGGGSPVTPCHWDDLVLDDGVIGLLKDDLTTFFHREDWFKRNRLPHRRATLLWGPPGCGKSSALRALLWTQRLEVTFAG